MDRNSLGIEARKSYHGFESNRSESKKAGYDSFLGL